ncbi:FAD-linked oxidase C-terminal domain-containing protein [Nocardioides sp.]|uniref:FAD-binding oxidoreductase n=1 Tax=Nocardioides sp. TaxID=35761 RepID=UPI00286D6B06|nr:FAD-linked oxidase C-terminal domain-containing protein [Nocardioides sp.]
MLETDPDVVASFAFDESRLTPRRSPWAVARPRDRAEVSACLRAAGVAHVPVFTRGAGSGLSGGANASDGALVVSTRRLDQILLIDEVDRIAVVQPGVVTGDLRRAVAAKGMFYPPDPGSVEMCTVGGNVATNAGGMCCLKYGVTGDFVLGIEAVLADGRTVRTGRRTIKGVAGYDLTHLFVGSEGTLGVITEITLRLLPAPGPSRAALATFSSLQSAGHAVTAVAAAGLDLSMLELMDRTVIRALEARSPMGFDDSVAAVLIAQSDAVGHDVVIEGFAQVCRGAGATEVATAVDEQESGVLLAARRMALPALEALGDWILDDVCVPKSQVVSLLTGIERLAVDAGVTVGVFGHAGDGNMHPTIIFDASDPTSTAAAHATFEAITALALELGGTVTGEHGIGRLKSRWLDRELDPVAMQLQRQVKDLLDPHGLLNPGVIFPESGSG